MERIQRMSTEIREARIETYLREKVREKGGTAIKLDPTYCIGIPDRLIVMGHGRVVWVELKREGEKPTKIQCVRHARLKRLGHEVHVLDSMEAVKVFVDGL